MGAVPTVNYKLLRDLPNVAVGNIFEGTPYFVDVIDSMGEIHRYYKQNIHNFDDWFGVVKESIKE